MTPPYYPPVTTTGVVAALTSEVTVSNSTVDQTILAYVLGANMPTVGTQIVAKARGNTDCQSAVATTLDIWLKDNTGTKVASLSISTPSNEEQANKVWRVEFLLLFRVVGASGEFILSGELRSEMPRTGTYIPDVDTVTIAIDTTVDNTFTLGMNWNTAAVLNVGRAEQAFFVKDAA